MRIDRLLLTIVLFTLLSQQLVIAAADVNGLQALIDKAQPGGEVIVPKGVCNEPLKIEKPIKLRGADRDACVVDVVADQPAIRLAHGKGEVVLENLTVRWKRATSGCVTEEQGAIVAKDGAVRLHNVRVIASDSFARCPVGFTANGFADVKIDACEFEGFDFALHFAGGAKAVIADSVVANPGHCGITAGPESNVEVTRTIVTGSRYHGVRCTGGELNVHDNVIIANKNRGIYLGNKSATGTIHDNVIQGNGAGISAFGESEVKVHNNFIASSEAAGIDMRDSCRLNVAQNLLANNGRAMVLFPESGKNRNTVARNASAGNKTETEGFQSSPPDLQKVEGQVAEGEFAIAKARGFGLTDPAAIKPVWQRWTARRASAGATGASAAEKPSPTKSAD
ncbi:MAG: hypothetical protein QOF78_2050 [Phycisphaerales bacterium]|jgi:nitrous oxidase accessory protein NosD|nr:hypothetical protein [Phycisphaerales bacterium]